MCVDRLHIVSLFLSNPCTPSTLSKEAFCPTEIPQPPFEWKYYHSLMTRYPSLVLGIWSTTPSQKVQRNAGTQDPLGGRVQVYGSVGGSFGVWWMSCGIKTGRKCGIYTKSNVKSYDVTNQCDADPPAKVQCMYTGQPQCVPNTQRLLRYKFKLRFWFHMNVHRETWLCASRFGWFWGCTIFSGIW